MYGSYYLIHLSLDHLVSDKPSLLHFKATAPYFIWVEDFARDQLLPDVRSQLGAEYSLMAIEKCYCYSAEEEKMAGEVDFSFEGNIMQTEEDISAAITKAALPITERVAS